MYKSSYYFDDFRAYLPFPKHIVYLIAKDPFLPQQECPGLGLTKRLIMLISFRKTQLINIKNTR